MTSYIIIFLTISIVAYLSFYKSGIVKYIFLIFTISFISSQIYYRYLNSNIPPKDIEVYKANEEASLARMSSSKVISSLTGFDSGPLFSFAPSDLVKKTFYMETLLVEFFVSIFFIFTMISGFVLMARYTYEWHLSTEKDSQENREQR